MGEQATDSVRNWIRVAVATFLVVGCPLLLVLALGSSGTVDSPFLRVAAGVALSLVASHAGAAYWRRRGGGDLLFGELLVWGWIGRCRLERSIASAERLLEPQARADRLTQVERRRRARLLERLSQRLEVRDPYTHGHSRRVARHCAAVAERMALSPDQVAKIRSAAAIHDVGKIEVPRRVVEKRGSLDEAEYALIKRHAAAGARMAAALGDEEVAAIVRHHHERLDGNGYPDGLTGEEIPLGARIVAVADTFDALTSERPYRSAAAHRKALAVLEAESGTQLDREVVRAFRRHYAEHPRVALWSLVANGSRQLLQPLVERLGLGAPASVAKVAAVSAVAVAGAGAVTPAGSAEDPRLFAGGGAAAERSIDPAESRRAGGASAPSVARAERREGDASPRTGTASRPVTRPVTGSAPVAAPLPASSSAPPPSPPSPSGSGDGDRTPTPIRDGTPPRHKPVPTEPPEPTVSADRVATAVTDSVKDAADDTLANSLTVELAPSAGEEVSSTVRDVSSTASAKRPNLGVGGS
jgi:hypothetical protein